MPATASRSAGVNPVARDVNGIASRATSSSAAQASHWGFRFSEPDRWTSRAATKNVAAAASRAVPRTYPATVLPPPSGGGV